MLGGILDDLLTSPSTGPCITATRHFAARPPVLVPFPGSLDPRIADALRARGIGELYSHQARAWELIQKGQNVVVVTPTASGKTLCYNLPALQALVHQPDARVLYLFPTKALAQYQLAELEELARQLPEMRMFTYDGDSDREARGRPGAEGDAAHQRADPEHGEDPVLGGVRGMADRPVRELELRVRGPRREPAQQGYEERPRPFGAEVAGREPEDRRHPEEWGKPDPATRRHASILGGSWSGRERA